ncbi:MAG: TolC family protein [Planctomycetota bacterium]|jgi:outer membrane protein TolC
MAAGVPPLPEDPSLDDYLRYAAEHNPGLKAAFERWQAALERIPQATSLPDPRFTYRYFIEHVETRVGPQEQSVGLAQMFPWFGKLSLRGSMAAEAAEAAGRRLEAERLKLCYRVKHAYYEYHYLARAVAVVERTRDLVERLEEVVRTRYKAGAAEHSEVIRAQVELGKLEDRLLTLRELRGPIVARLNAALNRLPGAPLPWPRELREEEISASDEEILIWYRDANPQLQALRHEIAREEHAILLAAKDYYPDVTVGLDYIDTGGARMPGVSDSGKDPVIAMVSVNVPLWRAKYRAGEREAQARHRAAVGARAERENELGSHIKMVLYGFRDAERKIDLYRDTLVPKARQSLRATETAFRAGKAGFSDLVDAERILLEFELSHERARADCAQRLAELDMLTGREIPRGTAPGPEQTTDADAARGQEATEND